MRKTNDTSRPAALNDTLADSELDAVTGGFIADLVRQSIQLANEAHYQNDGEFDCGGERRRDPIHHRELGEDQ